MDERTAVLIWNPRAGRGGAGRREAEVARFRDLLARNRIAVEAMPTGCTGDATRLAREAIAHGARDIIIAGGDGTINEALQAIIGARGVRLGIWARGTANVLARELRLPRTPDGAAQVILANHTRESFVGCATIEATGARRYFFLMAGIGLDASIVRGVPVSLKRKVGEAAFWYAGLAHLARWHPTSFTVETCGATYPATFAAIGRASRYGGGLRVTPGARLAAPDFQLCIVASHSRRRYLRLLAAALRNRVAQEAARQIAQAHAPRDIALLHTPRVRIIGDAPVQLDGELVGQLPMTFEIAPHPVTLFAPESHRSEGQ